MSGAGHNNPPVQFELTREEAEFLSGALDSEMELGLNILGAIQRGEFSEDAAVKVVAKMEHVRPILRKLKDAMK